MLVLPWLSRRSLLRLAKFASLVVYVVSARERKVGLANLEHVFPGWAPARHKAVLRASAFRFCVMLLDLFWFSRNTRDRIDKHVHFDDSARDLLVNEAWLGVTGHYGNWEILGMAMSQMGYPLMSVAAPLKNPKVDELFIKVREKTGGTILKQDGAIRNILNGLRNGGRMAVLLDQNTLPRDRGIWVDFFDLPCPVSSAPGALALKTGVPIRFGFCVLRADGDYSAFCPGVIPKPEGTVEELTQELTDRMEEVIELAPENWLWMYKRWKYVPEGGDRKYFPFYARPIQPRHLKK